MKNVKPYLKPSIYIILGSFLIAIGVNVFLAPNKISSGGVSTIATVLLHLFNVRMSITTFLVNLVLFILGFKYLRKEAMVKTCIGILTLTGFLELTSFIPIYSDDMLLATVCGGFFVGLGLGLVVRQNASTGGSDFGALIIKKFLPHISMAHIILALDCAVIVVSGVVFKSVTITIYSVIAMFICSKVTDAVSTLGTKAKAVHIFSEKSEEIAKYILEEVDRGVTGIHTKGMYSGNEKLMLLCVVTPKELPRLVSDVKKIDPKAFIVINDSREVLGEGFFNNSVYDL